MRCLSVLLVCSVAAIAACEAKPPPPRTALEYTQHAKRDYERALESGPQVADLHNAVAFLLASLDTRLDEAERLFRENLRADPNDAFARGGLLKVRERRGGTSPAP